MLKAVGEDLGEAAAELMKTMTPARIDSWTHSPPMDWANASLAIAERAQTQYCIRQGASCELPAGKVKIDAAYVVANAPVVREQLQRAGVRRAHLLDAAWESNSCIPTRPGLSAGVFLCRARSADIRWL